MTPGEGGGQAPQVLNKVIGFECLSLHAGVNKHDRISFKDFNKFKNSWRIFRGGGALRYIADRYFSSHSDF